jgi:hypothetical protein
MILRWVFFCSLVWGGTHTRLKLSSISYILPCLCSREEVKSFLISCFLFIFVRRSSSSIRSNDSASRVNSSSSANYWIPRSSSVLSSGLSRRIRISQPSAVVTTIRCCSFTVVAIVRIAHVRLSPFIHKLRPGFTLSRFDGHRLSWSGWSGFWQSLLEDRWGYVTTKLPRSAWPSISPMP